MRRLLLASIASLAWVAQAQDETPELVVTAGAAPVLDGKIGDDEYAGAVRFQVKRGSDVHGTGRLLRHQRQLYIAYRSRLSELAFALRISFRDPVSKLKTIAIIHPLNPPKPPISFFREAARTGAKRVSAADAAVRFDFSGTDGFRMELRLPLDLVEIGRNDRPYGFAVEAWDIRTEHTYALYPLVSLGTGVGWARLKPADTWGFDVPLDVAAPAPVAALQLIEALEGERAGRALDGGERPQVLFSFMGWGGDGRRREKPLADLQQRLDREIKAHPDFASLRGMAMWVCIGRNDFEGALAVVDSIAKDFPLLTVAPAHWLVRAELLRGLGRYEEAIEDLTRESKRFRGDDVTSEQIRLLRYLQQMTKIEQKLRASEKDLPRVLLKTTKGEIELELFEDDAPNAVANFISLVERGFYNGTRFHWAEGGRNVVGGDRNSKDEDKFNDGFGDPGYLIESEPGRRANLRYHVAFTDKRLSRRTEGSTFMIHLAPLPALDGKSTVFARIVRGFEVAHRLEYYDTLESAKVLRKRDHPYEPVKR